MKKDSKFLSNYDATLLIQKFIPFVPFKYITMMQQLTFADGATFPFVEGTSLDHKCGQV